MFAKSGFHIKASRISSSFVVVALSFTHVSDFMRQTAVGMVGAPDLNSQISFHASRNLSNHLRRSRNLIRGMMAFRWLLRGKKSTDWSKTLK